MALRGLLAWGRAHQRQYPWRADRDPYRVLLAEILLHRTRADQVEPVYLSVLEKYPDLQSLASADTEELSALLYPLGLRWRIPLLLEALSIVLKEYRGEIPRDRSALEQLPGVGPYIAGAIRCFAFGEADPLLDTNTIRIAGRVHGIRVTDASRRSTRFSELIRQMLDPAHPRESNYALLDLGALICRPVTPRCADCPLRPHCAYGLSHT